MKRILIQMIITVILILTIKPCFGFDGEKELIAELTKGKQALVNNTGALGYSPGETTILETAYDNLFKNKDVPVCTVMKISIDLKYNPYDVIRLIYSNGKEVLIDQLCMCAVETGVNKSIVAEAARNAKTPLNKPIFSRDEIIQAQCLSGEKGLAYTEMDNIPPPISPPISPKPFSVSSPAL